MTYTPTTDEPTDDDMQEQVVAGAMATGFAFSRSEALEDWAMWLATHDAEVRAQALAPIREALAGHPHCDIHPDGDPITCGWKRAVASVQAALDKEDR